MKPKDVVAYLKPDNRHYSLQSTVDIRKVRFTQQIMNPF